MKDIEAAGILGAGTESANLARILALKGVQVRLFDMFRDNLRLSMARIEWALRKENRLDLIKDIEPVQDFSKLAGADIIIEVDDVYSTQRPELIAKAAQAAGEKCLFAIKCGAEPVAPLAAGLAGQDRFLGLRFHPPLAKNLLAEIVRPGGASSASLERCVEFARGIGKTPVIAHDTPGVIVERLRRPFILAALAILDSGKGSVNQIDTAIKTVGGMPQGPFEMADAIGLDSDIYAAEAVYRLLGNPARLVPSVTENRLVQHGHLGRHSSAGFYIYDDGEIVGENPSLRELVPYLGISSASPEKIFYAVMSKVCDEAKLLSSESMVSEFDMETAAQLAFGWPKGPLAWLRELDSLNALQTPPPDQWGDAL